MVSNKYMDGICGMLCCADKSIEQELDLKKDLYIIKNIMEAGV